MHTFVTIGRWGIHEKLSELFFIKGTLEIPVRRGGNFRAETEETQLLGVQEMREETWE